jgi:uncharacterized protein (TIGR02145 family)
MAFTLSCSSGDDNDGGGGNVDGGTVNINGQVWMKKNLDYNAPGSVCYDNQESNCDQYGRLYDWATAMALPSKCNNVLSTGDVDCAISAKHRGICPSNYHIPSDADWNALMKFANPSCSDNSDCAGAGTKLKSATGWNTGSGYIPGTDDYGFSALPGGYGYSGGIFYDAGNYGDWWSATEGSSGNAYYRYMYYNYEFAYWVNYSKGSLFSVRCLQD